MVQFNKGKVQVYTFNYFCFFLTVVYDYQGMKLVCAVVSILCFVLRETPENAELVEIVVFYESVDVMGLLQNGNDLLR